MRPLTENLTKTYGKVATATAKAELTYTPTTMNWNGYDSFYVFGKQIEGGVINQWSKVTVMPANSVYYEDTFVTDEKAGTVGIVYGGEWTTDGTDAADRDQTWIVVILTVGKRATQEILGTAMAAPL